MTRKRIALSHSRLNDYNQCPLKFKLKYLDKAKEFKIDMDKSPHLVRGTNVHEALEKVIVKINAGEKNLRMSSLPEVNTAMPLINSLFDNYQRVLPEAQIAIDDQWEHCEWFSHDAYYRAIFDAICLNKTEALIVDWKTGKFRDYTPPGGMGQLELSAAIALCLWPQMDSITTMYVYVDHKKTVKKTVTMADKERLMDHFKAEHEKVNADTDFIATTNQYCKWCEATKSQCRFSRKMDLTI